MRVDISAEAEADLKDIYEFIEQDSPAFAGKVTDDILDACERVAQFPYSGVMSPEQNNPNVRETFYRRYRIAYLVETDRLFVLAIKHTAMDRDN